MHIFSIFMFESETKNGNMALYDHIQIFFLRLFFINPIAWLKLINVLLF